MILRIDLEDETNELTKEQMSLVESVLTYAAKVENISPGAEVSVTFVDDEAIKEINREYRNKDAVTDVISFALNDDDTDLVIDEDIPNLLGDIIVSYPTMVRQANDYGHSLERELGFLVVHGFLHLLGYDHMNEVDELVMFRKQEEILEAYGLPK